MKLLCAALLLTLLLNACITTKTYSAEERKMKIENDNVMIVKNEGKKISGNSLLFLSGGAAIKLDDQQFTDKEIMAYQNKKAVFVKFDRAKDFFLLGS